MRISTGYLAQLHITLNGLCKNLWLCEPILSDLLKSKLIAAIGSPAIDLVILPNKAMIFTSTSMIGIDIDKVRLFYYWLCGWESEITAFCLAPYPHATPWQCNRVLAACCDFYYRWQTFNWLNSWLLVHFIISQT